MFLWESTDSPGATRAQPPVNPWHVGSGSITRNQTYSPCITGGFWTTGKSRYSHLEYESSYLRAKLL